MTVNELAERLFIADIARLEYDNATIRDKARTAIKYASLFQEEWREHEKRQEEEERHKLL